METTPSNPNVASNDVTYLVTAQTVMVGLRGRPYTLPVDHPTVPDLLKALDEGASYDRVRELVDSAFVLERISEGRVTVEKGRVRFEGEDLHGFLIERILDHYGRKLPLRPLLRFLDRLMENPSRRIVQELYPFLERCGLHLTDDGCFIGYKSVRPDFRDWRENRFDNTPGNILQMRRNQVDDDSRLDCSNGFHVGTREYAFGFHRHEGRRIVAVKVDPVDVVRVPGEADKMGVCRYEVLWELSEDEILRGFQQPQYRADEIDERRGAPSPTLDLEYDEACPDCAKQDVVRQTDGSRQCTACGMRWRMVGTGACDDRSR